MRTVTGAVLAVLALGLLAGCRAGPGDPGVATAHGAKAKAGAAPSMDAEERERKFTQCLRDHGIEVQDPEPGAAGAIRITGSTGPEGKDPFGECRQYMPEGKFNEPDPAQLEKFRQYAVCMREHGIDMPDPETNGGGLVLKNGDGAGRINPDNPAFKEAEKACQDKLPGRMAVAGQAGGGE